MSGQHNYGAHRIQHANANSHWQRPHFPLMVILNRNYLDSNRSVPLPNSCTHRCDMVDQLQVRADLVKRLNTRSGVRCLRSEPLRTPRQDEGACDRSHNDQ